MNRPLIGITGRRYRLGLLAGADSRYGDRCVDSYVSDFASRIDEAGGVPVHLSYDTDPAAVCGWLSGVVITGGQDVHPMFWGGDTAVVRNVDPRSDPMVHDAVRDAYEIALLRAAVAADVPVLGVCRGMQILNVALGGSLVAELPLGEVRHLSLETALSDGTADHMVAFEPGSLAAGLFGERTVTNSWHHQAIDRCGADLVVTGRTSDGVVEAIEHSRARALGVQWHPEWMASVDPTLTWIVQASAEHLRTTRSATGAGKVRR